MAGILRRMFLSPACAEPGTLRVRERERVPLHARALSETTVAMRAHNAAMQDTSATAQPLAYAEDRTSAAATAPPRRVPLREREKERPYTRPSGARISVTWCSRLSFLLRILFWAAKAPWRPAQKRIRSKKERLEKLRGRCWLAGAARTWARSSAEIKIERSEQICDTMYLASFGVTRRGSASKGKGIAAACAVEKERVRDQGQKFCNAAPWRPAQKRIRSKKERLEKLRGRCW